MFRRIAWIPAALALALASAMSAADNSVQVRAGGGWVDSGVDISPGASVSITAQGTVQYSDADPCGPAGLQRGWKDLLRVMPYNDAGRGALLGRWGNDDAAQPFLIGASMDTQPLRGGRLWLNINQSQFDSADGAYTVRISIRSAGRKTAAIPVAKLPRLTQAQIDSIPPRVSDAQGNVGDRTNFIIVGPQAALLQTLDAAGWVQANKTKQNAFVTGLLQSLSKESYVQMPMSELMLFGRVQDYGYAHADPLTVVATRHHFRIWKAPFTAGGQTVWVGAGTHDIGFERDQRNNGITHKIDPDVDKERDFIASSLTDTGMAASVDYMTPSNPLKEARTATGGTFHSDGRTLVVVLAGAGADDSATFADVFCSVLAQENPDGGSWSPCSKYLGVSGRTDVKLNPIAGNYRLLVVPGIMNTCIPTAAWADGTKHLHDTHKVAVDLIPVPNDSSESNAQVISSWVRDHSSGDARKFVVLGYSKGAPDLETALATDQQLVGRVAAFVTVAGAVGGSPIADVLPAQADRWIKQYGGLACKGDMTQGYRSLRSDVRKAFRSAHPSVPVPAYSLAAASDRATTSRALLESWLMLASMGSREDGQLLEEDALLPGAKFLGELNADHFAPALAFEKGNFPRSALLEAVMRYVTADLDGSH